MPERVRLGVYSDLPYRSDGRHLYTHQAFVGFVTALPPRIDEVVVFGRLDPEPGSSHYRLPDEGLRFVPLPHYARVTDLRGQARALRGTLAAFRRELERLDAVWIFGPHPVALALALSARLHRKPLFLGVRQDYGSYIRNRLPGRRWAWAVPVAGALDAVFRLLARRAPTIAVGEALAARYRGGAAATLATGFSLVRAEDLVPLEEALGRPWNGELRVVTVGRIDAEKNPLLLPEILRLLRARDPRWTLSIVGEGPLHETLEARIRELGLEDAVELRGYVANGPELWQVYREASAFLHVSLTEGLPQVLAEAQAAGLPVVATDVGGVRAAVGGGESALLVPADDAEAAAAALSRFADEPQLRRRLVEAGLANAARETREAQLDRIAAFIRAELAR